ncbi:hypothetical protein LSH36_2g06053 [Paralvinella palmiformis]|uniref:Uncharacterized protein n=1 Tax=Paralvinella palmiformis TaxID=53620 RepID=A0AAD9KF66_9ANNE|nr:hypothetical protein LSH36_2g06053 [Paralvinella palmiformis]
MIDALYRVNGVLDDAIHWIIYGTRKNGMPVWDETADKLLMMESSQTTKRLLKSYTIQEISHRKVFLSEN